MAETLPDGTMQGYYNICKDCGKTIEVNMQGTPINHKCEVKNLDIPHVIKSVCDKHQWTFFRVERIRQCHVCGKTENY